MAWWCYGPDDDSLHPGVDAKPSQDAQRNAIKKITPLLQRDESPSDPQPIKRRTSNWLGGNSGFGKREWLERGFGRDDGENVARALPPPPWIAFSALAALCPGVFGDSGRGTSDASASGQALARLSHAENIACRQQIEDWDREHGYLYQNATKATEAAVQAKLVPVAYRTIYTWILARRKRK
ncbi:hypothetical protein [uncultured Thiocystis sp.]|uniref:hypothetical protein n=1 Tax=uncultured Thiocystis sp. TaxID=1202134 RepID=UPI0025DA764B|nr:hypothetical protein [uncultured Thiocystis sp.]